MPQWSFYRHMPVYVRGGRLLGRTLEIAHAVDYVVVQEGCLLVLDWYVPMSAVRDVNEHGIYLNVGKGEMRINGWNVPPEDLLMRQGATPGYEYTQAADIPVNADRHEATEASQV